MPSYLNKTKNKYEEVRGYNGGLATAGFISHLLSNANTPAGALSNYQFNIAATDFVTHRQTDNGQNILSLSVDPLTDNTVSTIIQKKSADAPFRFEFEMGLSQRVKGSFTAVEMVDLSETPVEPPAAIPIATISHTATTLTVILQQPFNGNLGDMFSITGLADNRLNYANCVVSSVAIDKKTVTATVSDEVTLPSLTAGPINGSGMFVPYWNLLGVSNGMGMRFSGVSSTSAVLVSRRAGGDIQEGGTLVGSHLSTVATTMSTYTASGGGKVEIKAPSRYRMSTDPDCSLFSDTVADASSSMWGTRARRTAVKPGWAREYTPRIRAVCPPSMTKPIAKIVSISKAGSTTATVTTAQPHGLTVANYVAIAGVADQVNFANSGSAHQVLSVIDANRFTCAFGAVATTSSYGGGVILANGQVTQPGQIPQAITWMAATASTDTLSLGGSASWTGVNVGDYVNLFGVRSTAGADLGVDGAYEVIHISTITMYVKAVTDMFGTRISPVFPNINEACGGMAIHRTTLRIHDMLLAEESQTQVMIDGQGTGRTDKAIPVNTISTVNIQGASGHGATAINPVVVGGRALTSNPTAASTGQQVYDLATLIGAKVIRPYSIPEADVSYTGSVTVNTDVSVFAAAGIGLRRYVTAFQVQNTGAAATLFTIKDGTTVKWQCSLPAGMTSPVDVELPTPLASTANAAINVNTATASTVLVNVQGYTAP